MTHTGKRFVQARESLKLTREQLAERLDVQEEMLARIETDEAKPSAVLLRRFIDQHAISSDWLLTGEGEMVIDDTEIFPRSETIPLINVSSRSGYLDSGGSDQFIDTLARYKLPGLDDAQGMRIFEVDGDAMLPTFYPGDFIVCEQLKDPRLIKKDTLGVVIAEHAISINRLNYFDGEQHDALILQSDKAKNPPRMIEMKNVKEVWEVRLRLTMAFDHILLFNHQKFVVLEQELFDMKSQLKQLQELFHERIK